MIPEPLLPGWSWLCLVFLVGVPEHGWHLKRGNNESITDLRMRWYTLTHLDCWEYYSELHCPPRTEIHHQSLEPLQYLRVGDSFCLSFCVSIFYQYFKLFKSLKLSTQNLTQYFEWFKQASKLLLQLGCLSYQPPLRMPRSAPTHSNPELRTSRKF